MEFITICLPVDVPAHGEMFEGISEADSLTRGAGSFSIAGGGVSLTLPGPTGELNDPPPLVLALALGGGADTGVPLPPQAAASANDMMITNKSASLFFTFFMFFLL